MRTIVLLNPSADMGRASEKWQSIAHEMAKILPSAPSVQDRMRSWGRQIEEGARQGRVLIVAAGGDGTVHLVAGLILSLPELLRSRISMGAVGLGSSNDFHKPLDRGRFFGGIPVRCSVADAVDQNALRVEFLGIDGSWRTEFAVANASVGMIAFGNDLFERRWSPVGVSRRLGASAGIACASLASVVLSKDVRLNLAVDGGAVYEGATSLLGVYVNRHFAGSLRYSDETNALSGHMGVTLLGDTTVRERFSLLAAATNGGLPGPPRSRLWHGRSCHSVFENTTLLEMDGEIRRVKEFRASLLRGALRVCQ